MSKEEKYKKIIQDACRALAGYRCPSFTKEQQEQSLADCWELLAPVAYNYKEDDESG